MVNSPQAGRKIVQPWMLQCQWHWSIHNYSVDFSMAHIITVYVSVTLSTLQLWMLQCQWHCQPCSYGCSSVNDTGASITTVLTLAWPISSQSRPQTQSRIQHASMHYANTPVLPWMLHMIQIRYSTSTREYIPRIMLTATPCVLLWLSIDPILPISYMVASMALGQS